MELTNYQVDMIQERIVFDAASRLRIAYKIVDEIGHEENALLEKAKRHREKINILKAEGYDYTKSKKAYEQTQYRLQKIRAAKLEVEELEDFFQSRWYMMLCLNIPSDKMLDRIRELSIADGGKKKWYVKRAK